MKIYQQNQVNTYLNLLKKRRLFDSFDLDVTVKSILERVRQNGDKALFDLTKQFDGISVSSFKITQTEIENALPFLTSDELQVIQQAIDNIRNFHQHQLEKTWTVKPETDIVLGQKITPIERVGVYVPGGKAFYPSSLLMNVIPAQVAGCKDIVVVTPPSKETGTVNRKVLAACQLLGISEVYSVGGAQSIAALTFGTQTIPPVDMIVGPGNQFVAKAKQLVFGMVKIDSIAGPSEICIIADETADPDFIIMDLFSQAEHDEQAAVTLITHSKKWADKVLEKLPILLEKQTRKAIIRQSLDNYGAVILTENSEKSFEIANEIAPEHLEIAMENAEQFLEKVNHAGAVFLGHFSPEAVGDYFAGPNHVLPTCGTARFFSPLGVYDFLKRTSIIQYSQTAIARNGEKIAKFADMENLSAHAESIRIRLK